MTAQCARSTIPEEMITSEIRKLIPKPFRKIPGVLLDYSLRETFEFVTKILDRVNGVGKNGVGTIAKTCFKKFNLEILSNVWKPAHPWLAPGWSGQALTLDSSTRLP